MTNEAGQAVEGQFQADARPMPTPGLYAGPEDDFGRDTFDDDLAWIFARFAERTGARGLVLLDSPGDDQPSRVIHVLGLAASDHAVEAMLIDQIKATPPRVMEFSGFAGAPDKDGPLVTLVLQLARNDHQAVSLAAIFADEPASRQLALYACSRLEPVLRGYFKLWLLNRAQRRRIDGLASALNATDIAVFMLDGQGDLAFINHAGRNLIDKADGIRRLGSGLVAVDLQDALRLRVAIDHVLTASEDDLTAPVVSLQRSGEGRALIAAITRCERPPERVGDPAAIIYVFSPDIAIAPQVTPVCQHHGLTRSETRLVTHLAEGLSITQAAKAMRCAVPTARSYLKQIFQKTGTNRQSELIRLVMASLARVRHNQQALKTFAMLAFCL
ncbi:MAG: helix-turn-helix transcriptional regulator [Alphaproteobacteria bacterium]|nr:helix-turn-helix transcriptional regulator [Alphaproteobacteria bacterium]MBU0793602.1 helix-turn-helix transcriptional regulator [Alphaproteobacteria bacterium]MBU0876970.1 helix-turn-helix transcriptional regulator [Alphaproteobacteria bacterium]MBU1771035.1 helix-turn-helix transcriptional regulator [Alphaproteobacteria bacterium]